MRGTTLNDLSLFVAFVTFYLLGTTIPGEPSTRLEFWATFLGVTSATLAALQYAPQIVHTYRMKVVGALSIPMMLIQTPGAIFMVLSIALRYARVTFKPGYMGVISWFHIGQALTGPAG